MLEILVVLRAAVRSRKWARRGKPRMIAVDMSGIKERLAEVLRPTGIVVGYFMPPEPT